MVGEGLIIYFLAHDIFSGTSVVQFSNSNTLPLTFFVNPRNLMVVSELVYLA